MLLPGAPPPWVGSVRSMAPTASCEPPGLRVEPPASFAGGMLRSHPLDEARRNPVDSPRPAPTGTDKEQILAIGADARRAVLV